MVCEGATFLYIIYIYLKMKRVPVVFQIRQGEIGPFESIKLEIIFAPHIPGETKQDFYIKFSGMTSKPVRDKTFIIYNDILSCVKIIIKMLNHIRIFVYLF